MMMIMMMMMMMIFFVYYRLKFQKCNTIPLKVTFKLVAQVNNLENRKNEFDSFFLLLLTSLFFKKCSFSLLHFPYLSL